MNINWKKINFNVFHMGKKVLLHIGFSCEKWNERRMEIWYENYAMYLIIQFLSNY